MFNSNEITDGITAGVELRQERGLQIAKTARIDRKADGRWLVPSMSGNGRYEVDPVAGTCTCPDFKERGCRCKHQYAVEIAATRETTVSADGSTTVTETVTVKATKKTTYAQNWPAYNEAQTHEQDEFLRLLADLCSGLPTPEQKGRGQRRLPMPDAVFAVVFKVYSTFSGRRFISDLRAAHSAGMISTLPHFNSIFNYLENPELFPILTRLVEESAKPLAAVESDFAADSTGFATSRFVRWFDHKYGVVKQEHDWVKVHMMCGVKTNVVTAVEIKSRNANDIQQLPALLDTTAKAFTMSEVSCDKGYSSYQSMNDIASHGATPFIMFKKDATTGNAKGPNRHRDRSVWEKMFHFFSFKQDEFLAHYHKRSNIESTVSMIKAKFGDAVRSKTEVAMKNEALCKVLCHNICCLISAFYELGIESKFLQPATA